MVNEGEEEYRKWYWNLVREAGGRARWIVYNEVAGRQFVATHDRWP